MSLQVQKIYRRFKFNTNFWKKVAFRGKYYGYLLILKLDGKSLGILKKNVLGKSKSFSCVNINKVDMVYRFDFVGTILNHFTDTRAPNVLHQMDNTSFIGK